MDRFGKLAISDHVLNLKVFVGNQVVRRDKRVCLLSGKILTLPLDFQMLLSQLLASFLSVRRFLLLTRKSSLESFESRLCFSVVSGVLNCSAFRVSEIGFEPDINAQLLPRYHMLDFALRIDAELAGVSICSSDNTNTLDQLEREFLDALIGITNELEASNATAISEDDMSASLVKLPPCGFVLHRSIVVLKSGISFLARFLALTVLIESGDSKPCTGGRCLTSHGVEATSKGVFICQNSTIGLQVVLGDVLAIHPQSQAFVADELDRTNSFSNGSILLFAPIKFVLVDQHVCLLLSRIWVYHITHVNIHIFMIEERKMNILLCRKVYPLCPSPKSGRPIHPPLKRPVFYPHLPNGFCETAKGADCHC